MVSLVGRYFYDCRSPNAESYLNYLSVLLSTESAFIDVGGEELSVAQVIVDYLIRHGFYELLGQSVQRIVSIFFV